MRTVTLYTTLGKLVKVETDATTWGDLKPLVQENGISTTEMKATENKNKAVLESDQAVLPEGDFTVFFTKAKSKAGLVNPEECSYAELRTEISEITREEAEGKEHFTVDGKNYTNVPQSTLRSLLKDWYAKDEAVLKQDTSSQVETESAGPSQKVTAGEAISALNKFFEDRVEEDDFDAGEAEAALFNLRDYVDAVEDVEDILSEELALETFIQRESISPIDEERTSLEQEMANLGLK